MFHHNEADVLVAGGGPVGLFASLVLARRGARVHIVDEGSREAGRSYALALHPGTLQALAEEGLAGAILAHAQRVDQVVFYDGHTRALEVPLAPLGSPFPFVAILSQHELEAVLAERLREHATKVRWSHRVASLAEGPPLAVQVHRLGRASSGYAVARPEWVVDAVTTEHPRYLIGADGHRSLVRGQLGLDFESKGESSLYAVFEMTCDTELAREMRVVLGRHTTDVLWPLPGGRVRWSFQLPDEEHLRLWREKSRLAFNVNEHSFPQLDMASLEELVRERAPWFRLPQVRDLQWSVLVRFERRLASAFGRGQVWLAGDAAHLAGPVSVRSMNVGLREARDLSERLSRVLKGEATADVLEAYGRERLAEWRELLELEQRAHASPAADPLARALAFLPASGAELATLARTAGIEALSA